MCPMVSRPRRFYEFSSIDRAFLFAFLALRFFLGTMWKEAFGKRRVVLRQHWHLISGLLLAFWPFIWQSTRLFEKSGFGPSQSNPLLEFQRTGFKLALAESIVAFWYTVFFILSFPEQQFLISILSFSSELFCVSVGSDSSILPTFLNLLSPEKEYLMCQLFFFFLLSFIFSFSIPSLRNVNPSFYSRWPRFPSPWRLRFQIVCALPRSPTPKPAQTHTSRLPNPLASWRKRSSRRKRRTSSASRSSTTLRWRKGKKKTKWEREKEKGNEARANASIGYSAPRIESKRRVSLSTYIHGLSGGKAHTHTHMPTAPFCHPTSILESEAAEWIAKPESAALPVVSLPSVSVSTCHPLRRKTNIQFPAFSTFSVILLFIRYMLLLFLSVFVITTPRGNGCRRVVLSCIPALSTPQFPLHTWLHNSIPDHFSTQKKVNWVKEQCYG